MKLFILFVGLTAAMNSIASDAGSLGSIRDSQETVTLKINKDINLEVSEWFKKDGKASIVELPSKNGLKCTVYLSEKIDEVKLKKDEEVEITVRDFSSNWTHIIFENHPTLNYMSCSVAVKTPYYSCSVSAGPDQKQVVYGKLNCLARLSKPIKHIDTTSRHLESQDQLKDVIGALDSDGSSITILQN